MGIQNMRARARALGASLAELAAAEVAALRGDLRASVRHAGLGSVLTLVGALLLAGAGAALALAGFEALVLLLPRWAAALVIAGSLVLLGLILLAVGRVQLRQVESPVRTVQRRVEDHLRWWQRRLAGGESSSTDDEVD
jgi:hypothetical protein